MLGFRRNQIGTISWYLWALITDVFIAVWRSEKTITTTWHETLETTYGRTRATSYVSGNCDRVNGGKDNEEFQWFWKRAGFSWSSRLDMREERWIQCYHAKHPGNTYPEYKQHRTGQFRNSRNQTNLPTCLRNSLLVILVVICYRHNLQKLRGFRGGRRVEEHLVTMHLVLDKLSSANVPIWIVSLDLSKAFDRVHWPAPWRALSEQGLSEHMIWMIKNLYRNQQGQVVGSNGCSRSFAIP